MTAAHAKATEKPPPEKRRAATDSVAAPATQILDQQSQHIIRAYRLQRLVEHLHRLGPRAVYEFLVELVVAHGIEADILHRLEDFGRLDRRVLDALGGDRFAASPIHAVRARVA